MPPAPGLRQPAEDQRLSAAGGAGLVRGGDGDGDGILFFGGKAMDGLYGFYFHYMIHTVDIFIHRYLSRYSENLDDLQ